MRNKKKTSAKLEQINVQITGGQSRQVIVFIILYKHHSFLSIYESKDIVQTRIQRSKQKGQLQNMCRLRNKRIINHV